MHCILQSQILQAVEKQIHSRVNPCGSSGSPELSLNWNYNDYCTLALVPLKMGQLSFVIALFMHFSSSLFTTHRWMDASLLSPLYKAQQIRGILYYSDSAHTYSLNESHEKRLCGIDFILFPCLWKTDGLLNLIYLFFLIGTWHWSLGTADPFHTEMDLTWGSQRTYACIFQSSYLGQLFVKFLEFRNS